MSAPRRTVFVVVLAVLGIALAAAITWGTSQLTRQRIGLASEPLTAGRRLLPHVASAPVKLTRPSAQAAPATSTQTQSLPTPSTAAPTRPAPPTTAPPSAPSSSAPTGAPSRSTPLGHGSGSEGSRGDSGSHRDD